MNMELVNTGLDYCVTDISWPALAHNFPQVLRVKGRGQLKYYQQVVLDYKVLA